jgi:acyl-CoA reductase-like NAD-dependent aldehyde dehydrogenase
VRRLAGSDTPAAGRRWRSTARPRAARSRGAGDASRLFSAAGTCGQRCTSLRRLIVHESLRGELVSRLQRTFAQIRVGDPREASTLVGPLIDGAFNAREK